jgi:glycosyltransferase involved in cell wall biosynthesis
MRVLVVTVVHHPDDARIRHRQIRALLDAGHEVTYLAPFAACEVALPAGAPVGSLQAVDVPRAVGRRRAAALRAARREIAAHGRSADIVLLHDPELLLAIAGLRCLPAVVWDIHEDTAAALGMKPWLPRPARPVAAAAVRAAERWAARRYRLLLAESAYQARFSREWPVVPNTTYVPSEVSPPGVERAVYVGHLSRARGALDMVELARRSASHGIRVELVGSADSEVRPALTQAHEAGVLHWAGFLPNAAAMRLLDGALAGLSLLHDQPNYRHSQPTKVIEYMAHGVPVVTTPLPPARALVEQHGAGLVVPFEDPEAAVAALVRLRDDQALRERAGQQGHLAAREQFHWPNHADKFVRQLEDWARASDRREGLPRS